MEFFKLDLVFWHSYFIQNLKKEEENKQIPGNFTSLLSTIQTTDLSLQTLTIVNFKESKVSKQFENLTESLRFHEIWNTGQILKEGGQRRKTEIFFKNIYRSFVENWQHTEVIRYTITHFILKYVDPTLIFLVIILRTSVYLLMFGHSAQKYTRNVIWGEYIIIVYYDMIKVATEVKQYQVYQHLWNRQ